MGMILITTIIVLWGLYIAYKSFTKGKDVNGCDNSTNEHKVSVNYTDKYDLLLQTPQWQEKHKASVYYTDKYNLLLQTPQWQEKRKEILKRDGYKCVWCGKTYDLQIHHKWYCKCPNGVKKDPWEYDNKVFMTLCDDCHKKYHSKYKVKTVYCKCRK